MFFEDVEMDVKYYATATAIDTVLEPLLLWKLITIPMRVFMTH
jgi:hypothetical protein